MTSTDRPDGPNQSDGTEPLRRRDLRNEATYLPTSVEELVALRQAVIDLGHTEQIANGLIGWLIAKAGRQPDAGSARTRSAYRKILAELPALAPPPEQPERSLKVVAGEGKGTGRRARGGGKLASVVALAIAGAGIGTAVPSSTPTRAATTADQAIRVVSVQEAGKSDVLSSRRRRRGSGRKAA